MAMSETRRPHFKPHQELWRRALAGLLLTPVAAVIGAVALGIMEGFLKTQIAPVHWEMIPLTATTLGLPIGSMLAAPVILIAFPLLRSLCPGRTVGTLAVFLAAGLIAGFASPWLVVCFMMERAPPLTQNGLEILCSGAIAGLCVAWPYFLFTRP
jgi:hypothetical protein